jgi:hypothetical protein
VDIELNRSLNGSRVSEMSSLDDTCYIFGLREKIAFGRRSYLDAKKIPQESQILHFKLVVQL